MGAEAVPVYAVGLLTTLERLNVDLVAYIASYFCLKMFVVMSLANMYLNEYYT